MFSEAFSQFQVKDCNQPNVHMWGNDTVATKYVETVLHPVFVLIALGFLVKGELTLILTQT